MKKYYFISALVGYITGCIMAPITLGLDAGLAIVAIAVAPIHVYSSFAEYNGGSLAVTTTSIAITQLIAVCIIEKIKHLPWVIYISIFIAFAVPAYWGGTVIVDSVLR
ncbi:hypothetical protein [Pontiella sulfatireligans]|uniref:hypothetical protein n=1 Tax=Pontiella sulfatireligans TaxID=2750658 RepID=UPI00109C76C3|nr:hypothetical protein [Pontiella sulfatireligans]